MDFYNMQRQQEWDKNLGENIEEAKKEILSILNKQKVSLSKARTLFSYILIEIEDKNPITL